MLRALLFPLCFLFVLCNLFFYGNCQNYNEQGWRAAGKYMKIAINETADPCNDFYNFACGNWAKRYEGKYRNEGDRAIDDTIQTLMEAIAAIRPNDPNTPNYQKRLKTFYDQCINSTESEEEILNEIYAQVEKIIGPMPMIAGKYKETNAYKVMGQMLQYFNTTVMVRATVEREAVGCGFGPILALHPVRPRDSDRVSVNSSLAKWLEKMANKQKGSTMNLQKRMDALASFEKKILSAWELRNWSSPETHEVDKLASEFNHNNSTQLGNWSDYFMALFPEYAYKLWRTPSRGNANEESSQEGKPTRAKLYQATYFRQLDDLLAEYGIETLVDYAYWRSMRKYLTYFIDPPQYYDLRNITNASDERICVDYVLAYASAAAARLLFATQGSDVKDWKYDIELIVQAVLSAFRYTIYNTDVLDLEDKVVLMSKLKTITVDSGVPEWLLTDKAVEEHTPAFDPAKSTFENDMQMFRDKFIWAMRSLWRNETDEDSKDDQPDSLMNPEPMFIPSAQYIDQRMEVTLGALLPPLYNVSYPMALKFGSLGSIVGEQLMRAFDPDAMTKRIGFENLLKQVSILQYRRRQTCFAVMADSITDCVEKENETEKCNAVLAGELLKAAGDSADIEGMKLAYMAYAFMAQTVGREPSLPELSDYDADQLYFLSYARFLCGNQDMVKKYLTHMPAFGKAFNCAYGDRYFPNVTCSVWSGVTDTFIARRGE